MKKWKLNRKFGSPLKRRKYLQFIYRSVLIEKDRSVLIENGYCFPDNMAQQVQSYQTSLLGYLENLNMFMKIKDVKFRDFQL